MNWLTRHNVLTREDKLPQNNPRLFEKVCVMVIRPFYVNGELMTEGSIISIERCLAESLKGIKVEIA